MAIAVLVGIDKRSTDFQNLLSGIYNTHKSATKRPLTLRSRGLHIFSELRNCYIQKGVTEKELALTSACTAVTADITIKTTVNMKNFS